MSAYVVFRRQVRDGQRTLLPVFAAIIGAIVLRQIPTVRDVAGITLVVLGVAIDRESNGRT
jgi:threonine/homoserine efflux transporter RhtA